jgi:glucokinase
MGGATAVGFDIGGTKIAYGVIASGGEPVEGPLSFPTPEDPHETLHRLRSAVRELRTRNDSLAAIGVGAAGLIDWPEGHIRWAPNNSYRDLPLRKLLEDACELPTVVDNDTNVAALAQARLSEAPGFMVFMTVGTGVGGGIVLGGELYRGNSGIAGEIGHMTVDPHGGERCGCGNVGCLEAVASGTALGRYGRVAAAADPLGALARATPDGAEVTGETVTSVALAGDATARSLLARVGDWLGVGVASLVTVLDVQRIVVGGGVAAAGALLIGPMRAGMDRHLFAPGHRVPPEIVLARHGVDAGWMGAGLLALDHLSTTNLGLP